MTVGHFADDRERQDAGGFGMLVFLASESLLFVALLAIYAGSWAAHGTAFAQGASHNLGWFGLAGTIALLCSSAAVAIAVGAVAEERRPRARLMLLLAIVLGIAFLSGKGYEYWDHIHRGLLPGGRGAFFERHPEPALVSFVNLYWLTTGLHALHVLAGIALLGFGIWCCGGREAAHRVELVAWYWHFVDLVWLFLWPLFYTVGDG